MRYDDSDYDIGMPRSSNVQPSSAGLIALICAGVSAGLLLVVLVLFIFLKQQGEVIQGQAEDSRWRWMFYWFSILDIVSLFAAIAAIITGIRGLAPTNPMYRGYSTVGLIVGIIELIGTILFGFIMGLAVCCLEINNRGQG